MMAINFTESQQRAIDSKGHSVVVSAAAGSGKTAVLVERIMQRITGENPVDIDRMLIVTFTIAAAADMKSKINRRLTERIIADPTNKNLARQQLLLQSANIGTTHSFCLDLITANFSKLGVSPDARVGDDATIKSLKLEAATKAIEQCYNEDEDVAREIAEVVSGGRSDKDFEAVVIQFADLIRGSFDGENSFNKNIEGSKESCLKYLKNYIVDIFNYAINCFEKSIEHSIGPLENRIEGLQMNIEMAKGFLKVCLEDGYQAIELLKEYKVIPLARKARGSDSESATAGKNLHDAAKKAIEGVCSIAESGDYIEEDFAYNRRVAINLYGVVQNYLHYYGESKEQKGLLDYTDLELLAIKLLYEDGEVSESGRYLASQFEEIYVDEYQDANEIQEMIYKAVSDDEKNIFMVGDVKQSIYGFRGALPELFLEKQRSFEVGNGGELIRLQNNFRSARGVVDFVNKVFLHNMEERFSGIDYQKEQLVCSSPMGTPGEAKLLTFAKGDGQKTVEAEALAVARKIRQMVDNRVSVFDEGEVRPCRYSDFAILLRVCKGVDNLFADALKALEIPAVVREEKLLFDAPEVAVLISFLQALHNPSLDIPLLATMLSPIFNFDADKLASLKKGGRSSFRETMQNSDDIEIQNFKSSFNEIRTQFATMPVLETLKSVVAKTGYIQSMMFRYKNPIVTQNIRLFFELLQEMQNRGSVYLSSVVFELNTMKRQEINPPAATVGLEGDRVNIMTIHKSKGLEFKICFVCDLTHRMNNENGARLLFDGELCCGFKRILEDGDFYADSMAYKIIKLKKSNDTIKEYLRVLYVALTRAEQKLFVPIEDKEVSEVFGERPMPYELARANSLLSFMKNVSGALDCEAIEDQMQEEVKTAPKTERKIIISDEIKEKVERKYRFSESIKTPSKLSVTELVHKEDGFEFTSKPLFATELRATDRGVAVHKLLQYISFDKDIKSEIKRLGEEGVLSQEQLMLIDEEAINKLIKGALSDIINKGKLLREFRFISAIEQKFGDKSMLQGVVDAIVLADDGIIIIDYKTDRVSDISILRGRYQEQLDLYATAIESHFERKVIKKYIVSVYKNEILEV